MTQTKEHKRLADDRVRNTYWRRWGPYVSERQWGTVREDYSPGGTAWESFPHDHARSRVYRWGEDGLFGISDTHQRLCFALALWNWRDPILKERLFGLTSGEGNHGEDVKEYYYYLDNTPTHSYMKALYKYPQAEYPYEELVKESRARDRNAPEFELFDAGAFKDNRYFDVQIEYAKNTPEDILIRITVVNRGPDTARLDVVPTLWFRNTWAWGRDPRKPMLSADHLPSNTVIRADHYAMGTYWLYAEKAVELFFTENETNYQRLYGLENPSPYVKDGINNAIVNEDKNAVNPLRVGTKAAARVTLNVPAGGKRTVRLRLSNVDGIPDPLGKEFDKIFDKRQQEADEFYEGLWPQGAAADSHTDDLKNIQRQAYAGMLWSKQYYNYVVDDWLHGDPAGPKPPEERLKGRNKAWEHMYSEDILSMPDKWEYPWFAAWDLAFHTIPLAMVDPDFAKRQLDVLTREWYMHPNGQLPAYEWALGDVNPPVHAWAAWRVYKIDKKITGQGDRMFLERVFQKLLLNFTWWVNRKDADGKNIFQGGFLGLDNIGVFDRNTPLPTGGRLEQSDGTSWMAMYSLNMLAIAFELANDNPAYEDIASKFFEHFLHIASAMNQIKHDGNGDPAHQGLWDEHDGFFYDMLQLPDGKRQPMRVRSIVGLIPLFAIQTMEIENIFKMHGFNRRMSWFVANRPDLTAHVSCNGKGGMSDRRILSLMSSEQLKRILHRMLDEKEFLSEYGIRSVSQIHRDQPFVVNVNGTEHKVNYEPAEAANAHFGGNSNWRGPVWFPINFLIIEALQKFHHYYGDDFTVECPTGSGRQMTLWEVGQELERRLIGIFERDGSGRRAVFGNNETFQFDPLWNDYIPFYEYFHGDNGAGVGASHQTGWTGLIAKLIQQRAEWSRRSVPHSSSKKRPSGV